MLWRLVNPPSAGVVRTVSLAPDGGTRGCAHELESVDGRRRFHTRDRAGEGGSDEGAVPEAGERAAVIGGAEGPLVVDLGRIGAFSHAPRRTCQ